MRGISLFKFTRSPPVVTGSPMDMKSPAKSPDGLKSDPLILRKIGAGAVGEFLKNSITAGVAAGRIVKTARLVATVYVSLPTL